MTVASVAHFSYITALKFKTNRLSLQPESFSLCPENLGTNHIE
jgi:hypothetical protein